MIPFALLESLLEHVATGDTRKEEQQEEQRQNFLGVCQHLLLGELNNKPRTSYLAKIRNPHPKLAPQAEKKG